MYWLKLELTQVEAVFLKSTIEKAKITMLRRTEDPFESFPDREKAQRDYLTYTQLYAKINSGLVQVKKVCSNLG